MAYTDARSGREKGGPSFESALIKLAAAGALVAAIIYGINEVTGGIFFGGVGDGYLADGTLVKDVPVQGLLQSDESHAEAMRERTSGSYQP